jgi:hypothetical protein
MHLGMGGSGPLVPASADDSALPHHHRSDTGIGRGPPLPLSRLIQGNALDLLTLEPGAFYVINRGYVDFERLYAFTLVPAFFVTRAKSNIQYRRRYSRPVDRSTGLICDQTIVLTGSKSRKAYPETLRRVKFRDHETGKTLVFLANNFALPALVIY